MAAATDISRAKVTEGYARQLGLPLVVIDNRMSPEGSMRVHGVIGTVENRDVLLFDDEIITGESILDGAGAVLARGARSVHAGCVHGTLAPGAAARIIDSELETLVVTDTIPQSRLDGSSTRFAVVSVAEHFADAIRAIHEETSISALFT